MHNYPSDISRGQFELIRAKLEQVKHKTKPRKYDFSNYLKWQLVYYYFKVWSKQDEQGISLIDKLLKKISQNSTQ